MQTGRILSSVKRVPPIPRNGVHDHLGFPRPGCEDCNMPACCCTCPEGPTILVEHELRWRGMQRQAIRYSHGRMHRWVYRVLEWLTVPALDNFAARMAVLGGLAPEIPEVDNSRRTRKAFAHISHYPTDDQW